MKQGSDNNPADMSGAFMFFGKTRDAHFDMRSREGRKSLGSIQP